MLTTKARWSSLVLALAAGCGSSNLPPQILTLTAQTVEVNRKLEFDVKATDEDSDTLTFAMVGAPKGARLDQVSGRIAAFSWTPDPSQVGSHTLTFSASDGKSTDEETIDIKVSGGSPPRLVSSDRFTFDLKVGEPPKFALEWADDSATALQFAFDPDPRDWGAILDLSAKSVGFDWAPTDEQKKVAQHLFKVTATNAASGQKAENTISVIFRGGVDVDCPAGMHLPVVFPEEIPDQTGSADYPVKADIADEDTAIQLAAVFYTTAKSPADADWRSSYLAPGSRASWVGVIPNLDLPPGQSVLVTFYVCGMDDDDPSGDACDNQGCSEDHTFTAWGSAPCAPGYRPGPTGCVDIDECATDNGGCDLLTTCANTPGSRTCGACPAGYRGDGASGCKDLDECATDNGGCDLLTRCINTPGSRTCGVCPMGYSGDGASGCKDLDECANRNGGCDKLTTCTNVPGSRTCGACPAGYSGDGATGCKDLDECATDNGGCDPLVACTNTLGSRTCGGCPVGYAPKGGTCEDIDECATGNGGCDKLTVCTNTPGSRTCGACPPAYTGSGATGCVLGPNGCLENGVGRLIVAPQAGDLVITEVMADPFKVPDTDGEWLEIFVRSDVDLNGVEILAGARGATLTVKTTLASANCLRPGATSYIVLAKKTDKAANGGLANVFAALVPSLNNSNGQAIVRSGGLDLDKVAWATSTPGASLQVSASKVDATLNDAAAAWCTTPAGTVYGDGDRGTPGAANSACP